MRETLRWIGYAVLAIIVTVSIVFAFFRIRGPSQAQREALAKMQKDYRPKQGMNAFPLLWYLEYDVPEADVAKRFDAEVAWVRERLAADKMPMPYAPQAKALPETAGDRSRLCELRAGGCLAKVTADPEVMRATLATYPVIRGRDKAFDATDYYWDDFPADTRAITAAVPNVAQRVWLSAYALDYADGHRSAALSDTCANLDAWRRMHRGTNSLIGSMIAIASADGAMRLFADMLAALPAGETVPEACTQALRPIEAADVDRCAEMAGEFAFGESTLRWVGVRADREESWAERVGNWVTSDIPQWRAWAAERDAQYCEDPPTTMLADVPHASDDLRVTQRLECISSVIGCMLADIGAGAYADYDARTLDFAAHLRLAAALLWLRDGDGTKPLTQRFDERPAALRSGTRASAYDASAGTLFVDNRDKRRDARFALPVAAAQAVASK